MDDSYMEASKRVMGAIPERPASADCHVVGMSLPMGVTAPRPVTTTLVMKRAYPCSKHAPVAQGIPSLPANISRSAPFPHPLGPGRRTEETSTQPSRQTPPPRQTGRGQGVGSSSNQLPNTNSPSPSDGEGAGGWGSPRNSIATTQPAPYTTPVSTRNA